SRPIKRLVVEVPPRRLRRVGPTLGEGRSLGLKRLPAVVGLVVGGEGAGSNVSRVASGARVTRPRGPYLCRGGVVDTDTGPALPRREMAHGAEHVRHQLNVLHVMGNGTSIVIVVLSM